MMTLVKNKKLNKIQIKYKKIVIIKQTLLLKFHNQDLNPQWIYPKAYFKLGI